MPLNPKDVENIHRYCDRDLAKLEWYVERFDFVSDEELRRHLAKEFASARYISKLGEAIAADGAKLESHAKFQVVLYASIYEAVISYLLWEDFKEHPAVTEIEYHKTFKKVAKFPGGVSVTNADGEELHLCAERTEKTNRASIKFPDKLDAAVAIGFLNRELADEVGEFYKLRNALHIETAAKKDVQYELDQARLAYLRMQPFIDNIKEFLKG